jgi:hypothetical protein
MSGECRTSTREGIQTVIDQLVKTRSQMKNLNPSDLIDPSILKEMRIAAWLKSCTETRGRGYIMRMPHGIREV